MNGRLPLAILFLALSAAVAWSVVRQSGLGHGRAEARQERARAERERARRLPAGGGRGHLLFEAR